MRLLARAFSSHTSPAAAAVPGEESVPYLRSLFRAPPKETISSALRNSCSFVGTVVRPVKPVASDAPAHRCVSTVLKVNSAPASAKLMTASSPSTLFRLTLLMKDKLALMALKHLKLDDFIYVRGPLGCYQKINESGHCTTLHKVFVKDLNFVRRDNNFAKVKSSEMPKNHAAGILTYEEGRRDRLHLWQIFFANPHEWWDNRQLKPHPRCPDFRHKNTHECLWIRSDDPPWVRKQLQLYDSNMSQWPQTDGGSNKLKVRQWEFSEL